MNRKEYILNLLKNGIIHFTYTGSEFGNDCISLETNLFMDYNRFTLYMPSMAWENIEVLIADFLDTDIKHGIIKLKLDIQKEAGTEKFTVWNHETGTFCLDNNHIPYRFKTEQDAYKWLCEKSLV